MNINQINGSNAGIPALYENFKLLIEASDEFETSLNSNQVIYHGQNLSFWYFYNTNLQNIPAYKNGIWVRYTNNNNLRGLRIWFFVLINQNNLKKVARAQ